MNQNITDQPYLLSQNLTAINHFTTLFAMTAIIMVVAAISIEIIQSAAFTAMVWLTASASAQPDIIHNK